MDDAAETYDDKVERFKQNRFRIQSAKEKAKKLEEAEQAARRQVVIATASGAAEAEELANLQQESAK